jgi:hypothetical protein
MLADSADTDPEFTTKVRVTTESQPFAATKVRV